MSGISAGVGIFSGIDTRSLIDQLMAIEARPRMFAEQRIIAIQRQQAAYLDLNSALNALKTASGAFYTNKVFDSAKATSSNTAVLTGIAGTNATPGTYEFLVHRLVTTNQQLSRGFTDKDQSAVGATSFTFEIGGGALQTETRLSELNGGAGVTRGKIEITDNTGASAIIDLSTVITVDDVIEAINSSSAISVTASVEGDRLVVRNNSGSGTITIANSFGSDTASDLGIAGTSTGGTITGSRIRTISGTTALSSLNDGLGVNIRDGAADLSITNRAGLQIQVTLGEITETTGDPPVTTIVQRRATTLQDVVDMINAESQEHSAGITASIDTVNNRLVITDSSGGTGNLIIESGAQGRTTAEDLGIATGPAGVAASTVNGERLIAGINSTLVKNLFGGDGLSASGLTVTDRSGASATITISASALAGSIADLIDNINDQLAAANVDVSAELNAPGNGLALRDTSGASGNMIVSGTAATALGLATAGDSDGYIRGSNLQLQWQSRATLLSSLNAGQGVGTGTFRITDASGATATVDVTSSIRTLDDLIQLINSRPIDVEAAINDTGDGIVITDTSGSITGTLKIEDVTGTVARSLNIAGEDNEDGGVIKIDGSFERTVTFEETDTLEDVAEKINAAGVGATATIINDGNGSSPFRLSLTSKYSGAIGRMIIDTGALDLGLTAMNKGSDAVVFFGSGDPANAVALTSSTNTLDSVISGVTIDLNSTSDEPVELVVSRDNEKIEKAVDDFVKAYNKVLDTIDKYDSYDQETNTRGVLLGDTAANNVRRSLLLTAQSRPIGVTQDLDFLFEAGVRIGAGSRLEFDREKFRAAMETDAASVERLFAARSLEPNEPVEIFPGVFVEDTEDDYSELGVAEQIRVLTENLTNSVDGLLTERSRSLDSQIELQRDRIERINKTLENKRARLERQFLAMEQAIAQLQSQQTALGSIRPLG